MSGLKSEINQQATQTVFNIESSSFRVFGSTRSALHGQQIDAVMVVDKHGDDVEPKCYRRNDMNQYSLSNLYGIVYDMIHRGYNDAAYFDYVTRSIIMTTFMQRITYYSS